jgi:hypothetical protein
MFVQGNAPPTLTADAKLSTGANTACLWLLWKMCITIFSYYASMIYRQCDWG